MAFAVHVQNMGEFVELHCMGKLVFDEGTNALRAAVVSQKSHQIVLNFTNVEAIDAAGVGTLTVLQQYARSSERTLVVAAPKRQVLDVLRLTKADSVLNLYLGEERWLRSAFSRITVPLRARICGV